MKIFSAPRVLIIGSLFVSVVWSVSVCLQKDPFAVSTLEPLFTGLALVAVIASFIHEREGAADRDKEHRELIEEMRRTARIQTHIALFQAWNERWGILKSSRPYTGEAGLVASDEQMHETWAQAEETRIFLEQTLKEKEHD